MKRKEINQAVPGLKLSARIEPSSFNEDDNTFDVVFTTGARVTRFGFLEDFVEELSTDPNHVRLDRLNDGAPFLNAHRAYDVRDVIGSIVPGSAKMVKTKKHGVAKVKLSSRDSNKEVVQDIRDGHLKNVSVGYRVHKFEEQDKLIQGKRHFMATDWEPYEVSSVPMGADPGAHVRADGDSNSCQFIMRGDGEMKQDKTNPPETPIAEVAPKTRAPEVDLEQVRAEAMKAERVRVSEITKAIEGVGLDDENLKRSLIDDGVSIDDANKRILEALAKRSKETSISSDKIEVTRGEHDQYNRGVENALLHRVNPKMVALTEEGRFYRGATLLDMLRVGLESRGEKTFGLRPQQMWKRAIELYKRNGSHSTADFPSVLENVLGKTLRMAYEAQSKTWAGFVREVTVPDFKQVSRVSFGDAPELELKKEGEETKSGTISDAAEKYSLATYAKMVRVSREMIVNDDLDAFTRLPQMFGRRAAEKEADLVYSVLMTNAALSDSVALFHGTHGNLNAGSGAAALDEDTLSDMRAAMLKQTGLDGSRINAVPIGLLVPPELLTAAQKLVSSVVADSTGNVNVFSNLSVSSDQRLSDSSFNGSVGDSATAHYLYASPDQLDIIELARLEGESGPVIENDDMFDTDGVKVKCRLDAVAKAIDFRGLQKNDGA